MNYIIHPAAIYAVNVCGAAKVVCVITACVGAVFLLFMCLFTVDLAESDGEAVTEKRRKILRVAFWIVVASAVGAVFIPSKETLIEIMIAKAATRENVAMTVDALKSVVDYVIEAVKGG